MPFGFFNFFAVKKLRSSYYNIKVNNDTIFLHLVLTLEGEETGIYVQHICTIILKKLEKKVSEL